MDNKDNRQATLSPQDQLSDMIWGFTKSQLIYVAAKLEIADLWQIAAKPSAAISSPLFLLGATPIS